MREDYETRKGYKREGLEMRERNETRERYEMRGG